MRHSLRYCFLPRGTSGVHPILHVWSCCCLRLDQPACGGPPQSKRFSIVIQSQSCGSWLFGSRYLPPTGASRVAAHWHASPIHELDSFGTRIMSYRRNSVGSLMESQANGNPIAVRRKGSFGTMRFSTRLTAGGRNCQSQISGMVQCIKSFLASKRRWPASEPQRRRNSKFGVKCLIL